jgi:hypothetical protein
LGYLSESKRKWVLSCTYAESAALGLRAAVMRMIARVCCSGRVNFGFVTPMRPKRWTLLIEERSSGHV